MTKRTLLGRIALYTGAPLLFGAASLGLFYQNVKEAVNARQSLMYPPVSHENFVRCRGTQDAKNAWNFFMDINKDGNVKAIRVYDDGTAYYTDVNSENKLFSAWRRVDTASREENNLVGFLQETPTLQSAYRVYVDSCDY